MMVLDLARDKGLMARIFSLPGTGFLGETGFSVFIWQSIILIGTYVSFMINPALGPYQIWIAVVLIMVLAMPGTYLVEKPIARFIRRKYIDRVAGPLRQTHVVCQGRVTSGAAGGMWRRDQRHVDYVHGLVRYLIEVSQNHSPGSWPARSGHRPSVCQQLLQERATVLRVQPVQARQMQYNGYRIDIAKRILPRFMSQGFLCYQRAGPTTRE
ncbi:MAG: hypothetical protein WBM76_11780 [Woeseiaceae bacterium]